MDSQPLFLQTPADEYELLDFGRGRCLERFGSFVVERPWRWAEGARRLRHWDADWTYVQEGVEGGHWAPRRQGLPGHWVFALDGIPFHCRLDADGRIGLKPEQLLCGRWAQERLAGCYHMDEIRVLHLFAGEGLVTACALNAGATVVHVDADADVLDRAAANVGRDNVEFVQEDGLAYVEAAIRARQRFDLVVVTPPFIGRGPHHRSWDIAVDLAKLAKRLPQLVSDQCRGIWLAIRPGSWSESSLAQLLRDALPGRKVEALQVGLETADGRRLAAGVAARWYDESADRLLGDARQVPLTAEQIEARLDVPLDAVLSSRRTAAGPARRLAEFAREQQDFILHWVEVTAHTNSEMAYQFAAFAAEALERMDLDGVEAWLIHAMDAFDTRGLHAGIAALREVGHFAEFVHTGGQAVALADTAPVLEAFVQGLNGRRLRVEAAEVPYTDTDSLFLPPVVNRCSERADNFALYRAMVVHQWAQTWFGTWRAEALAVLEGADRDRLARFHRLEQLRLAACIARTLPGEARRMADLAARLDGPAALPEAWQAAARALARPGAGVGDSLRWLERLAAAPLPPPLCYMGTIQPDAVARARTARLERDRQAFRVALLRWQDNLARLESAARDGQAGDDPDEARSMAQRLGLREVADAEAPDGVAYEITLDGKPLAPPDDVRGTMMSILQDLGQIPEDYLQAAGPGAYYAGVPAGEAQDATSVWQGTYHEEGAFHYNEWDYERQHYRKNWTVLRELEVTPRHDDFAQRTLARYSGLVKSLRRVFEALRGEERLLKKQPHGDDIDIDALVEAHADVCAGMEMTDRLFTRMRKVERDIAVMFMVDMSGSTKGWINDAEREALLLLSESLETLGDRYAIYGFSGMTRKRCEVYRVKRFDEPYDEAVRARISGIEPRDYTRMGVAIRHLGGMLAKIEARTRLLITLSDGKPDDYDSYRGEYGIEDTRKALIEIKQQGIHPYCITIDTEARDYLPHMYGAVGYTLVDEVRKLPLKVSDIYRRLTT